MGCVRWGQKFAWFMRNHSTGISSLDGFCIYNINSHIMNWGFRFINNIEYWNMFRWLLKLLFAKYDNINFYKLINILTKITCYHYAHKVVPLSTPISLPLNTILHNINPPPKQWPAIVCVMLRGNSLKPRLKLYPRTSLVVIFPSYIKQTICCRTLLFMCENVYITRRARFSGKMEYLRQTYPTHLAHHAMYIFNDGFHLNNTPLLICASTPSPWMDMHKRIYLRCNWIISVQNIINGRATAV